MSLYWKFSLALLLATALLMIWEYRDLKARRKYQSTIFGAVTKPLVRVYLKAEFKPSWVQDKNVRAIIAELKSFGFEEGKSYIVHELNGLLLHSLFLNDFAAVVVKHQTEGIWVDIIYQRDNGELYIATNSPIGNEQDSHEKNIKFCRRDATAVGLYNFLKSETERKFSKSITNDNFKAVIEEYYRKEICHKNNKGGITIRDFKENIKKTSPNLKISKEDLRKIFLEMKVDELHHWHDACIEKYRKDTKQTGTKFNHLDYALFIVPKKTISAAFIEYLAFYNIIEAKRKDTLIEAFRKKTNMQKIFEIINNAFPEDRKARYVCDVDHPVDAQLYYRKN